MKPLALMLPLLFTTTAAAQRPNVVLIITDDIGYGDIGSYGAPDVRTPNIDRLARQGVRFTDFYANAPVCTPTRAGLVSGRYQQRFELEEPLGATPGDSVRGLRVNGRSLPQLLKNSGYATALIGKWHLGLRPEFSPRAHGFDYFFGFKSGYVDYYQHTDGTGRPDWFENDTEVATPGYSTDLFTDRSLRFIQEHREQPFFVELAYNAAHWPYQPPGHPSTARDNGRHLMPYDSATSTRADYVAIMERADQGVGRILAKLDSLRLANNTLVIFTNDNGGEWLSRNAPLFSRKWSVWEGGIRVPAIIRWPGHIPAGTVTHQVGITMDLTASILAATGAAVPADTKLDGINLLPILSGKAPVAERNLFWRIKSGGRSQTAVRSGDQKLVIDGTNAMLYNVRLDLGERNDLAATEPRVAARLWGLLKAWQKDVDGEAAEAAIPAPTHRLKPTPATIAYGWYDAAGVPVLRIKSGDVVEIGTLITSTPARLEAAGVKPADVEPSLRAIVDSVKTKGPGGHILTGPIYVEGAEPGDVLEVRILKVDLALPYGYNAFAPTRGWLPEDFDSARTRIIPLDAKAMTARFNDRITVPLAPFFGSMGVAPPPSFGKISSAPPGIHAGNLDNKHLVAGTTLYIPVHAKGALFEVGDGHAAQGNGEVDITAIETSLTGRFQFIVRKDLKLTWPRAETPTHWIAMGIDSSLVVATKTAVRQAIEFLVTVKGMTREDAYQLTSVAGDVEITQLVDGTLGVHVMIPKKLFVK